jgi:hypothetical protein
MQNQIYRSTACFRGKSKALFIEQLGRREIQDAGADHGGRQDGAQCIAHAFWFRGAG